MNKEARNKRAYETFRETFFQSKHIDGTIRIGPIEECTFGSGQMIIPISGVRVQEEFEVYVEHLGYETSTRREPYDDSLYNVVIVPLSNRSPSTGKEFPRQRRENSGTIFTLGRLFVFMLILIAVGVSQTPRHVWEQILG